MNSDADRSRLAPNLLIWSQANAGVPMADRFVPERINDFLTERAGRRYCDSCIQERLGLRWRQQVQLVTATLAVTPSFTRARSECCTCHEVKQVIAALEPRSVVEARSLQRPTPAAAKLLRRGQV